MKVRVLGCSGGVTPGLHTTAYLIDDTFLIDAGSVCGNLDLKDQARLKHIFITHTHLDHVKDLAFLADNMTERRAHTINVYGSLACIEGLRNHFFNDVIWPDFTQIPNPKRPVVRLIPIRTDGHGMRLGPYDILPIEVNHIEGSVGYMVTKGETSVLFTGDTAPTERIWNVARDTHGLKAVFTEMSFPAELQWLADVSRHFSAVTFERELRKMRDLNVPIYIGHFKPGLEGKLAKEYKQRKLASYGVQILNQGEIFKFDSRTRERTRGLLVQTHIQAKYSNRKY